MSHPAPAVPTTGARGVLTGLRFLGQGLATALRRPKLLLLGAIPAVLTTALMLGGLVTLAYWAGDLATWVTPFADGWAEWLRKTIRFTAGLAVVVGAVAVSVVAFTAITLVVGGPFYEHISETVEDSLGGVPEGERAGWFRMLVLGLRDSALLIVVAILCNLPLFLAGFIPVVGQTVIPVVVACVGGWILALELVAVPFTRRGLNLGARHRTLRNHRAMVLGLGVPAYLLCAVPFLSIIAMPVAFIGATIMAREALTQGPVSPNR
ncbi:CysZ protein [Crossiella equi]|uniref:CysZ protein n=1 Tax=Crossiella equi TaxID=130796 RepID=A0ABS5ABE9_9PSEU|nr:EI24 domain-containing protein [Crossiella equi]MBP2473020.1 CysZ protein [Crossiella equi]